MLVPTGDAQIDVVNVPIVGGEGEEHPVVAAVLCPDELTRSTTRVIIRLQADREDLFYHLYFAHGADAPVNTALRGVYQQTLVKGSVLVLRYDAAGRRYLSIESAVEKTGALCALKG